MCGEFYGAVFEAASAFTVNLKPLHSLCEDCMKDACIAALIKQIVDAPRKEVTVHSSAPALVNGVERQLSIMECSIAADFLDEGFPL